ncbi:helix-turn-helix domain-containing protein [Streptomyces capparidis]
MESSQWGGWGSDGGVRVTLERLLSVVGAGAVELCVAPRGLTAAVAGVAVLDPQEPGTTPGELLLAVGVDHESAVALDVVRRAGAAGTPAVVFGPGASGRPGPVLRSAAEEAGTAVLLRTPWCPWARLVGVLRAGLASLGAPQDPAVADVALGDLNGLADAVAALVGGSVTIEDTESRVLAHSSTEEDVDELRRLTILGRRVPPWRVAAMREAGFFQALWAAGDVLYRPAQGENPERLVAAVRAGGEALGSIWVAAGREPLAPDAADSLRAAARAAAAHLLHHRTRAAAGRAAEDAARALLEGRGPAQVLAERAALPLRGHCAVLAVHPGRDQGADALERLRGRLALHCEAQRHRAVVVLVGGRALVVLGALDEDARRAEEQVTRLGTALAGDVAAPGGRVRIALGDVVAGLAELPASRRSAEQALAALLAPGQTRAVARTRDVAEAVAMAQIMDALADVALPAPTPVARLAAAEAEHGGTLVETLRAYLDHFGDVPAAARALGVHPNSLRYRIRRITELSGLDLKDPEARLLAHLQVRLLAHGG